jgi:hypothetical protein
LVSTFGGEVLHHKTTYALVLLLIGGLLTSVAVTLLLPRNGTLIVSAVETTDSVGVYWDADCKNRVASVDWGNLFPGSTREFEVYVRNECNESVVLNLMAENWLPTVAEQDLSLSWNYAGCPICENQVKRVNLVLSVSPKVAYLTSFSFDIMINQQSFGLGEVATEKILSAPEGTVYFMYTDPAYLTQAEAAYDGTSGETVRNLCVNPQNYGFNTTQYWLLPSGAVNATTMHDATVAMFGGRLPNLAVNYYETVRGLTPVTCQIYSSYICFEDRAGSQLGILPLSALEAPRYHEDMFAAMVFYDEDGGNTFFLMYGFGWKGTWASGIYFKEVISRNPEAYTNQYYIFHWVDDNKQDGIPQAQEIQQIT